jgi:hypothetical protein
MEAIQWGDHSAVLVNDLSDIYFEYRKGVHQSNSLSSYLFLLTVVGLNKILSKGIGLDYFKGLDPYH